MSSSNDILRIHSLSLRVTIRGITYDTAEARLLAAARQQESLLSSDGMQTLLLYRQAGRHFLVRIRDQMETLHLEPASTEIVPLVLRMLRGYRVRRQKRERRPGE